jgi:hypothetical protein
VTPARIAPLFALLVLLAVGAPVRADTPPAGGLVYQVVVEDAPAADGMGVFGVVTGPDHPLGDGADVLAVRDGPDAFSSYLTIRSYTTGTDYVQTSASPASGNLLLPLEPYASVIPETDGYRAFYDVPGTTTAGESLAITSEVTSTGDGPGATVRLTATVANRNVFPVKVGARYLLDISLAGDDGPVVSQGGVTYGEEAALAFPGTPAVIGGGEYVESGGTQAPDAVTFAHWNRAFESAFDLAPDGGDVTSAGGLNDSALLYYFGGTSDSAVTLVPNESAIFSLVLGRTAPEDCANGLDDDRDGQADGADADCATATPTPAAASPSVSPAPSGPATPSPTLGPAGLPAAGGRILGMPASRVAILLLGGLVLLVASAGALRLARKPHSRDT